MPPGRSRRHLRQRTAPRSEHQGVSRPRSLSGRKEAAADPGESGLVQKLGPHMLLKHPMAHRGRLPVRGRGRNVGVLHVGLRRRRRPQRSRVPADPRPGPAVLGLRPRLRRAHQARPLRPRPPHRRPRPYLGHRRGHRTAHGGSSGRLRADAGRSRLHRRPGRAARRRTGDDRKARRGARQFPATAPAGRLFPISPAAVDLYTVGVHWALGDAGAALGAGKNLRADQFPTAERKARMGTDMARAW